jgi:adenine-specific DNA-methyltransferase
MEQLAQGIVAPQDYLNAAGCRRLGNKIPVGTGIFILTTEERNALSLTAAEEQLLKPFYDTTELGRYFGSPANKHWIIYTDSSFKKRAKISSYPAIKRHLDQFRKVITSHNGPYGLHRAREEHFFLGQKVIALRKCAEPCFTYTDFPCYVSQTHNVIQTDRVDLLYLTGLLNSRLVRFWLKHRGKMQGSHFQVDKEPILAIPIYAPAVSNQLKVATLVQRIIDCLSRMSETRSSAERDQLSRLMSQYRELSRTYTNFLTKKEKRYCVKLPRYFQCRSSGYLRMPSA